MTRRQQRLQKRDEEIYKLNETMTIEELSEKFNISIPSVYRVIRTQNLKLADLSNKQSQLG